jgi:hypothetical protein
MRIDEMRFYAVENNLQNCKENNSSFNRQFNQPWLRFTFPSLGAALVLRDNFDTQKMRREREGEEIIQFTELSFLGAKKMLFI